MCWLDVIWAPWRSKYIREVSSAKKQNREQRCIFCEAVKKDDNEALILYRGKSCYVMMNLYPYNTGHIMIIPYNHVPSIEYLSSSELLEMMQLVKISIKIIKQALNPDGFNIGINLGRAAGAGIEEHVHMHVVPRWVGDANFMPIIAGVKVLPQDVQETYKILKPYYEEIHANTIFENS